MAAREHTTPSPTKTIGGKPISLSVLMELEISFMIPSKSGTGLKGVFKVLTARSVMLVRPPDSIRISSAWLFKLGCQGASCKNNEGFILHVV